MTEQSRRTQTIRLAILPSFPDRVFVEREPDCYRSVNVKDFVSAVVAQVKREEDDGWSLM